MSTDSQGRPLSDDGQWAWSGTEWVPAAGGGSPAEPEDVGGTRIIQSPFAGGAPAGSPPAGGPPAGGPPEGATFVGTPPAAAGAAGGGYVGTTPETAVGSAPGYGGSTPGYVGSTPGSDPGWASVPKAPKNSRKTVIAVIVGVLVIAAVIIILIFALGGGGKKGPSGAFKCTSPNVSGSGTITFTSSTDYTLSDGGKGGKYSYSNNKLLFTSGSLANTTTTYRGKNFDLTVQGQKLNCKQ